MQETLAQFIRRRRRELGLKLRDLEQPSGLSNPYFSQLENGVVINPSIRTLYYLAFALDTDLETLVDLAIQPFREEHAKHVG